MQHIFTDVEAYGPPGIGKPFALGAVKFNARRGIIERWTRSIAWPEPQRIIAHQPTMHWLLQQRQEVIAQTAGGIPFAAAWHEFIAWVKDESPRTFWADDWSDFAWLDLEAREHLLPTLRDLGAQYDSSPIVKLGDPRPWDSRWYGAASMLIQHVAADDATTGALDLLGSLRSLRLDLPTT